jgi:hypothetical protein
LGSWLFALPPIPGSAALPPQTGSQPPAGAAPVVVTVAQNTPETVLDMGAVFGAMRGVQPGSGLRFAILGNTNSRLVQTDLSEAALTLTYTRGQCGTATITVGATDTDGVSVQRDVVVTVRPSSPAGTLGVMPTPVPAPVSTSLNPPT